MAEAKKSQKPESAGSGYGTDNPKDSQNIVNHGKPGHKAPPLGAVGVVPESGGHTNKKI